MLLCNCAAVFAMEKISSYNGKPTGVAPSVALCCGIGAWVMHVLSMCVCPQHGVVAFQSCNHALYPPFLAIVLLLTQSLQGRLWNVVFDGDVEAVKGVLAEGADLKGAEGSFELLTNRCD